MLAGAVVTLAAVAAACSDGDAQYESVDDIPEDTVVVAGMDFLPGEITVEAGDTVTWEFRDNGVAHDVTSINEDGHIPQDPLFESDQQSRGEFTHEFTEPGRYDYICSVHPDMTGTVIVEP